MNRRNGPVHVTRTPKAALEDAKRLADGNPARVRVQRDGSVIVKNTDDSEAARERRALHLNRNREEKP